MGATAAANRRLRCVGRALAATRSAEESGGWDGATMPPPPHLFRDSRMQEDTNARFHHPGTAVVYSAPAIPLDDVDSLVQAVQRDGFVVLRGAMSRQWVAACREAFAPRLAEWVRRKGENDPATRNRGAFRHYIDMPMSRPFSDLLASPHLDAVLSGVLGPDVVCDQFASDTPLPGSRLPGGTQDPLAAVTSTYQDVHGDLGDHDGGPTNVLAVNWPLCHVTELNGPFEMAVGGHTHRIPSDGAREAVTSGRAVLSRLLMSEGDVLIRDPRCVHRASPNLSDAPRP